MAVAAASGAILQHNRNLVLSTYRNLLRATRVAFNGKSDCYSPFAVSKQHGKTNIAQATSTCL